MHWSNNKIHEGESNNENRPRRNDEGLACEPYDFLKHLLQTNYVLIRLERQKCVQQHNPHSDWCWQKKVCCEESSQILIILKS